MKEIIKSQEEQTQITEKSKDQIEQILKYLKTGGDLGARGEAFESK